MFSTSMTASVKPLQQLYRNMLRFGARISVSLSGCGSRQLSYSKKLLQNPRAVKFGWSREVVGACLPFTSELISSRGRSLENMGVGYCPAHPAVTTPEDTVGIRRVDDSWLEMVLPFSDQTKLRESMMMDNGKTVRYGKLFELLDALAADVAYRHCGGMDSQLTIVTASVDGVKNFANINIVDDVKMQGYITYTGSSSMEVTIDILASREDGEDLLAETKFIMVARSGTKAARIPGLILSNEEAKHRYEVGAERARTRRARALQSLSVSPPKAEEVHLIHNLYLQSMRQTRSLSSDMSAHDQQVVAMLLNGEHLREKRESGGGRDEHAAGEQHAHHGGHHDKQHNHQHNGGHGQHGHSHGHGHGHGMISKETLLEYYRDLTEQSAVQKRWMKDTIYKSAQLMHVQDRNVHGKIFGGYIMKKAFEIAHVAAVCFFGEAYPHFLFVDDIQFVRPMNVGSLAEFTSTVVYSSQGHIVVQVVVMSVDIVSGERHKTNVLTYIFRSTVGEFADTCPVPKRATALSDVADGGHSGLTHAAGGQYGGHVGGGHGGVAASGAVAHRIPEVMPKDYHQIVLYLEGKRALDQIYRG